MKTFNILSWNIDNLGQNSRQKLQSLPTLIATLAVGQQADMIIFLTPRPAPKEEQGLAGALKRKALPGNNPAPMVRNIRDALNRLENLPAQDAGQKFQWQKLEIDPAFRPEDLPRSLTATVTGNERTGVQLEAGVFSHGGRPAPLRSGSKSGVKEVEKAAVWDNEVKKVQTRPGARPSFSPKLPYLGGRYRSAIFSPNLLSTTCTTALSTIRIFRRPNGIWLCGPKCTGNFRRSSALSIPWRSTIRRRQGRRLPAAALWRTSTA